MKELGITKGEYTVGMVTAVFYDIEISGDPSETYMELLSLHYKPEKEAKANVELFCDAGNTAQKCGLLPSELLRQRDELKEALIDMVWQFAYTSSKGYHTGGLSALEGAFYALGLSDPITILDFEAAIKNTDTSSEKPNNSEGGGE